MMTVNGVLVTLDASMSLADFLQSQGYIAARVAVERNGEIIPKASFSETMLSEEDVLEIVNFMGGG